MRCEIEVPIRAANRRLFQQKAGESRAHGRSALYALQLRESPQDVANHSGNGVWRLRSRLVARRNRDSGGCSFCANQAGALTKKPRELPTSRAINNSRGVRHFVPFMITSYRANGHAETDLGIRVDCRRDSDWPIPQWPH